MKKILLIALAVAIGLCMPIAAQAKAEFELGGYIRVDALWHSQSNYTHAFAGFVTRDNVNMANHGRFVMNANATRFNFTIKGPELWGGKVTGFIEVDFDGFDSADANNGARVTYSSFNQAKLRLRHAMFKITWPYNELLFGQYWSMNSELIPETADSGAYALFGATQARLTQVRVTHKFTDNFNGSVAIAAGQNGRWGLNTPSWTPLEGENSETPMIEAKLRYEADLYGKGAFYGKPRGFYVGLGAAYMRTYNQAGNAYGANWNTLWQNNFLGLNAVQTGLLNVPNKYTDHWMFLIENVTPIIPTHTKSLAGTLTLSHQWWIGKGVSAWRLDLPGNDRYYTFSGISNNGFTLDSSLNFIQRYGGHAQLQYYWTDEIYTNINFGFEKAFNWKGNRTDPVLLYQYGWIARNMTNVYLNGNNIDPVNSSWRASITQWYRPVSAVKFALQYTYSRTTYFQYTTVNSESTRNGEVHSVMANAWYLF